MSSRPLEVRLLGAVTVLRDGAPVALPRSRKVLALFALLALEGAQTRTRLVARIRERIPSYDVETLIRAFRFDRDTEGLLRANARTIGFGA